MKRVTWLVFALLVASCSSEITENNGKGGGLASTFEVEECQDACDQQRFFDCYDAQAHSNCFDDCASAGSADIDKFASCVDTANLCDPECSTHIEGRAEEVPEEDRVETDKEPQPEASNCEQACSAMVEDMCVPEECSQFCSDTEAAFVIVYCNNVREGCDFPDECTGEMSTGGTCTDGCDQMQTFGCLSAGDATECRNLCAEADDTTADNFSSCVQNAGSVCDAECYSILNEEGPSGDVSGCQTACDDLAFFDCLDSAQLSACRTECETASASSIDTFKSCEMAGICEDESCYTQLVEANN